MPHRAVIFRFRIPYLPKRKNLKKFLVIFSFLSQPMPWCSTSHDPLDSVRPITTLHPPSTWHSLQLCLPLSLSAKSTIFVLKTNRVSKMGQNRPFVSPGEISEIRNNIIVCLDFLYVVGIEQKMIRSIGKRVDPVNREECQKWGKGRSFSSPSGKKSKSEIAVLSDLVFSIFLVKSKS